MVVDSYAIIFLITHILGTYKIRKFMSIYFEVDEAKRWKEWLGYSFYYSITAIGALHIRIPIIMFCFNIMGIAVITLNYRTTTRKRILSIITTLAVLMITESLAVFMTGYFYIPAMTISKHSSEVNLIIMNVLSYSIILGIAEYKNLGRMEAIPKEYWKKIMLIPSMSIIMSIILMQNSELKPSTIVFSMIVILLINMTIFSLYDALARAWESQMEKSLLKQQNNYYEQQFDLMKKSLYNTRAVRHDLKNHLYVVKTLTEKGNPETLSEYIQQILEGCETEHTYAQSGNMIVDSIINFKLQDSEEEKIDIKINLKIPEEMTIKSFDMTIILGNLLDNALNATLKLKQDRKIEIEMQHLKGQYIIRVRNTYDGKILIQGEELITLHKDKENHGLGLKNIKSVIKKYDGMMDVKFKEKLFCVTIVLYE